MSDEKLNNICLRIIDYLSKIKKMKNDDAKISFYDDDLIEITYSKYDVTISYKISDKKFFYLEKFTISDESNKFNKFLRKYKIQSLLST